MTETTTVSFPPALTPPTLFDAIYSAGLFEGEGSVVIRRARGRAPGRHPHYCLEAIVTMCDREALDRLAGFYGGRMTRQDRSKHGWRPLFRWVISTRQAATFLVAIRPHLQTLRLQTKVDLGLAFQAQKRHIGREAGMEAYRARQLEFYEALKKLNLGGTEALTSEERIDVLTGLRLA